MDETKPAGKSCVLASCSCGGVKTGIYTAEFVSADPARAAALLNHAWFDLAALEKKQRRPKRA